MKASDLVKKHCKPCEKGTPSLNSGQVSEMLRSARGYQLLKLETSTPAETMKFEDARNQISDRVFTDMRKEEYDKFLDRLRAQAIIEWKNDELKKAYESQIAAEAKASQGAL